MSDIEKSILTELHYLPSIYWFYQIMDFDVVYVETQENFQKQTNRNRTAILSANGPLTLTIPVNNGRSSEKIKMKDLEIDYSQNWQVTHWRTLIASYANSPYFEYYAPDLEAIYLSKPGNLVDLNLKLLSFCLKCLRIRKEIQTTESYIFPTTMYTKDARSRIESNDLESWTNNQKIFSYPQVFGKEFVRNLSIIDLLSNLGPDSLGYLKRFREVV